MPKLREQSKPYSEEEALEEAARLKEKIETGEAKDYEEAEKLIEVEVENKQWKEIYKNTEARKVKKIPQEIEELLGGDLSEGKTFISSTDEKENVFAAVLEKHQSVKEHGIRYSVKTILKQEDKIYDSGFSTVRGAFRDERDNYAGWCEEIKILKVEGDIVTVGKASNDLIKIETVNLKTGKVNKVAKIDLAAEREKEELERLKKQLEESKNFEEVTQNTKELLKKSHTEVDTIELREDLKLLIGKDYTSTYDPVISDITFYLLRKGEETLEKFYKDPGVNTYDRPRFSIAFPAFDFGELQETENEIIIPVKMTIIQPVGAPVRYRNVLKKEEFEIKFKK